MRPIRNKRKRIRGTGLFSGLVSKAMVMTMALIVSIVSFGNVASANIFNLPGLKVSNESNYILDADHVFVPEINANTKIETFGGSGSAKWRTLPWSGTDNRQFFGIDVIHTTSNDGANLKGNIGVIYKDVGTYDGQKVDLKITLTNWGRYGDKGKVGSASPVGNMSFEKNRIAFTSQGFGWVDMNWQYLIHGTNKGLNTSGYFTFSDIDVSQHMVFSTSAVRNFDAFLVESRSNKLQFANRNGDYDIYDRTDIDVNDKTYDPNHAFTFTYRNLNSFTFRWKTDWANTTRLGRAVPPSRYMYTNVDSTALGEYLFYVKNKPAPTKIPNPRKSVDVSTNMDISKKLKYTITHVVPQEDSRFYHTSYKFVDKLDPVLNVNKSDVLIRNNLGQNVTGNFAINVSNGDVTATANKNTLNSAAFYGKTYTMEILASVNKAELEKRMGSNTSYVANNTVDLVVNGATYKSNKVTTTINKRKLTINHVDDKTGDLITSSNRFVYKGDSYTASPRTDLTNGNGEKYRPTTFDNKSGTIGDKDVVVEFRYNVQQITPLKKTVNYTTDLDITKPLTYEISHSIPAEDHARYFFDAYKIEDSISPVLDSPSKVSVRNKAGKDVSDLFNITVNGNKVALVAKPNVLKDKSFYGETYTVEITAKVNRAKLLSAMGNTDTHHIKNTASLGVNGRTSQSNEVDTTVIKRKLTINHLDADNNNKLIKTESRDVFRGDTYDEKPRTDLKRDDGYTYKPVNNNTVKGTVGTSNVLIEFKYYVPTVSLGIDKIQIYTDVVTTNTSKGLDTKVDISQGFGVNAALQDFKNAKMKLEVKDTTNNKVVYSKVYPLADFKGKFEFILPTNYLNKGAKVDYSYVIKVEHNGDNNHEIIVPTNATKTHGYTSSEKVITKADEEYKGVIMTEKEKNKDVKEFYETLTLNKESIPSMKTGYGFELLFTSTYSNDLKNLASISTNVFVDERLIDTYQSYDVASNMAKIPMDKTANVVGNANKQVESKFELPKVFVEQNTGYLFKTSAHEKRNEAFKLFDGGRKLYIPVWLEELGAYNMAYKSNSKIGVNKVTFNISDKVDVKAYMFNHIDSDTSDDDELLIHPLEQDGLSDD